MYKILVPTSQKTLFALITKINIEYIGSYRNNSCTLWSPFERLTNLGAKIEESFSIKYGDTHNYYLSWTIYTASDCNRKIYWIGSQRQESLLVLYYTVIFTYNCASESNNVRLIRSRINLLKPSDSFTYQQVKH